jgi:aminoglycoside phosphotransferase (APT) family kinase protein
VTAAPPAAGTPLAASLVAPDRPGPVRPGEELPVAALATWLRERLPALPPRPAPLPAKAAPENGAPAAAAELPGMDGAAEASGADKAQEAPAADRAAEALTVEQFPGGHSNLTYLLRWGGRELVLRRPPVGASVKSAHDMGREYRVLSRLHPYYPKAPRALAACDDAAVAGAPFFLMERVHGVILRRPPAAAPAARTAPSPVPAAGVAVAAPPASAASAAPAAGAAVADPPASAASAVPAAGAASPAPAAAAAPPASAAAGAPGASPTPAAPAGAALPPACLRALAEAAVDALAELHAVDVAAAGLADLGRPAGYAARQVSGWTERWRRAATDPVPDVERAAAWLADHLPRRSPAAEEAGAALLHNDFKHDNLVLAADLAAITAVLDWEMATVGEPLMDLGTSLGYWLDPDDEEALRLLPVGVTALPGNLSRREVVERYARATGRDVSGILFYYVFGLLKIAVIAQQIYHRYRSGLTSDRRFAPLLAGVRLLGRTAAQAIARRRIDRLWD